MTGGHGRRSGLARATNGARRIRISDEQRRQHRQPGDHCGRKERLLEPTQLGVLHRSYDETRVELEALFGRDLA